MTYNETLKSIKANAPSGATHFNCLGAYFKKVTGLWYVYSPFTMQWECTGTDKLEMLDEL